jgi:DNA-binding LacI/PurR family transcriptional regulator
MLHVTLEETKMSASAPRGASRDRVRGYRERLRRQGLRPIQIWVPDTRSPSFAAEAHRQSAAIAASPHEAEDQAFVDAVSDQADQ